MIREWRGLSPRLGSGVYLAPDATVIGDVEIGEQSSIWYGCILRGDDGRIRIGPRTNLQDGTIVHVTGGVADTHIGADVTVGHRVLLHGCTVADRVLVGMGAILMDNAIVEEYAFIGAGALVTPGTRVPAGMLALGAPARVVRPINDAERRAIDYGASHYVELAAEYAASEPR